MPPFLVLTDLDGTILPPPVGGVTPPLSEGGVCLEPLVRLLGLGCTIVAVTGSKLDTHRRLFFDALPLAARQTGRILMAVETGKRMYRSQPDGDLVEDVRYATFSTSRAPPLEAATVEELVEIGRTGIKRFYQDAAHEGANLVPEVLKQYIGTKDALDPPVTTDRSRYPRVEVREGNGSVVFAGVPAAVGLRYFSVPSQLKGHVDGKPTGRYSFDCVPAGLSKALVVEFLGETGTGELTRGRGLAIGDQPLGNDIGLTRQHDLGLPFVSVSERADMVPAHLASCHVTRMSNADASCAVLSVLAKRLEQEATVSCGPGSDASGSPQLTADVAAKLVRDINDAPGV